MIPNSAFLDLCNIYESLEEIKALTDLKIGTVKFTKDGRGYILLNDNTWTIFAYSNINSK